MLNRELRKLQIARADSVSCEGKPLRLGKASMIAAAIAFGLGLAGFYYYESSDLRESDKGKAAEIAPAERAIGFQDASILTATGYVVPSKMVEVGSKIVGRIEYLDVEEGDMVKKGQVIARVDSGELEAQLRQAEAALELAEARYKELSAGARPQEVEQAKARLDQAEANLRAARSNFERLRELYDKEVVSAQELEAARNLYEVKSAEYRAAAEHLALIKAGARPETIAVAEAEVRQARAQVAVYRTHLENVLIKAPIAGVVVEKMAEVGEVVAPGLGGKVSEPV